MHCFCLCACFHANFASLELCVASHTRHAAPPAGENTLLLRSWVRGISRTVCRSILIFFNLVFRSGCWYLRYLIVNLSKRVLLSHHKPYLYCKMSFKQKHSISMSVLIKPVSEQQGHGNTDIDPSAKWDLECFSIAEPDLQANLNVNNQWKYILTGSTCALSCGKIHFAPPHTHTHTTGPPTPNASLCPSFPCSSDNNNNTFKIYVFMSILCICLWNELFLFFFFLLLFFRRCEIEATLERLKKLERDLSTKEQELKEREQRLKMWERKLIEHSSSPVSPSLVLLHLDAPHFSTHVLLEALRRTDVCWSEEKKGGSQRRDEKHIGAVWVSMWNW